MSNIGINYL